MRFPVFLLFFLVLNFNNAFSQTDDAEKQMEQMKKEIQKKQDEYVNDFINTLEVDDFQKEIIKQKMHAYFDAKKSIYMSVNEQYKRDELVEQLDTTHFLDIKEMVTEDTMTKIMESVKGTTSKKGKKKKKGKSKKRD